MDENKEMDEEEDEISDSDSDEGDYLDRIMIKDDNMALLEKQIPSLRTTHTQIRRSIDIRRSSRLSFSAINPKFRPWLKQMIDFVVKSQQFVDGNVGFAFDLKRRTDIGRMLPTFSKMSTLLQAQLLCEE